MMNEEIEELAIKLRNISDKFDGNDSPADVIRVMLEQEISAIKGYEESVSEKQAELQERFIGYVIENEDTTLEELSEVERKQAEFRKRIFGK